MPTLRLYGPALHLPHKRALAEELTEVLLEALPDQRREWVRIHFVDALPEDVAIGGVLLADGQHPDCLVELASPALTQRRKQDLANALTLLLARVLGLRRHERQRIHVRFQTYRPEDLSIGGTFLHHFDAPRAAMVAAPLLAAAGVLWLVSRTRVSL